MFINDKYFNKLLSAIIITILLTVLCISKIKAAYDPTYVLAVSQKYAIPEDVDNGDLVGTWLKCLTWTTQSSISFSLLDTYNGGFAISSTGNITIADATKIDGQISSQDVTIALRVQTTDGSYSEIDTAYIRVKEASYCVFIDYSYVGTETGSRAQPRNDLDDVTI